MKTPWNLKKNVTLLLVLALLLSAFVGVGCAEEQPLTLKVLGRQRSGITFEETKTVHAWEVLMDMFAANNLAPEFTVVEADQFTTVLNATIANGDIPDFFICDTLSDVDRLNLIDQKLVMNIDDALQYSNGVARDAFAEGGMYYISRQGRSTEDGMYYFGQVSKQISVESDYFGPQAVVGNNCAMLIRQDWLDKLNLPMPTTLDELFDTLVAFQENDMNGNGLKDERICLDYANYMNGVAQWFGLAPFNYQMDRKTGEAKVPFLQESFTEYIAFLQKLVDAKVMWLGDSVSYYNGGTSEGSLLSNAMQENCVSAYFGAALVDHAMQTPEAVYTMIPAIHASTVLEPVMDASVGYKVWGNYAFSAKADPKAVAAFLDTICSQEYAKWVTFGVQDETYTIDPESGLYTFTASNVVADILESKIARGYPLVINAYLPDASQIGWYQEYYGPLNWMDYDSFMASRYFEDTLRSMYTENQMNNLITWCKDAQSIQMYNFNGDIGMVTPMLSEEEAEVIDMYSTDVDTFMAETLTGLLTGQNDLGEYESYVEELKAMGLDEVIAVRQAQYDRTRAK